MSAQDQHEMLERAQNYFNAESDSLRKALHLLASGKFGLYYPEDVAKLSFIDLEVLPDRYRVLVMPYDMERSAAGSSYLLGDKGLLPYELVFPGKLEQEDFLSFHHYSEELKQCFFEWFLHCWDEAVQLPPKVPVYLSFHESDESYDLLYKRWISGTAKGH